MSKISLEDLNKQAQEMKIMPGFKISWFYSGMEFEPVAKYSSNFNTKLFVRNGSRLSLYKITLIESIHFNEV